MYCPSCGKTVSEEQIFCRHCGEKQLSVIAASESSPDWLKRIGMFSLGAGAFFVCCFAFFFLIWKLGGTSDMSVIWFLLITSTVLSGIIFLLVSENKELRKKFDAKRERKPLEIAGQTVKMLEEKHSVPPVWSSVVENTTENLVGNRRSTTNDLR